MCIVSIRSFLIAGSKSLQYSNIAVMYRRGGVQRFPTVPLRLIPLPRISKNLISISSYGTYMHDYIMYHTL